MLKKVSVMLVFFLALNLNPAPAEGAEKDVPVTLPTFPVTLNGVKIDNAYSQYPLLVYKDITYVPMTYHGSRFLHLKANWYNNEYRNSQILFVGYSEDYEKEWNGYPMTEKNKSSLTAVIPSYKIAVNTLDEQEFIDNQTEEYPLLNFRGVTYFPLIWRFAVDEFGWQYSFDWQMGLIINSTDQLKAELEDEEYFSSSMPSASLTVKDYVYNDQKDAYAGYPRTNLGGATFVYQKQGEEKVYFKAADLFNDGEYYFNQQLDEKGSKTEAKTPPVLANDVLTIQAVKMDKEGEREVTLKIDLKDFKCLE